MPIVKIKGQNVDVDIRAELERFTWNKERWTEDKLIASSPFRYDKSPSFYVSLDGDYAGTWGDSGYYDEEWKSGGLVKLLSFLQGVSYDEVEEELLTEYGREWSYNETHELTKLSINTKLSRELDVSLIDQYKYRHPYLGRRGICERTQRLMRIGYDKGSKAVTIPWFNPDGSLANIKYRKTRSKIFWYRKGAAPIRSLVYGMNVIYDKNIEEAVLCEAEIDALSWWSIGRACIAIGGVNFTDKQADIIKRSPIKKLAICSDNDKAGEKLRLQVIQKLTGYVELSEINIPVEYKDANDAHVSEDHLSAYYEEREKRKQLTLTKFPGNTGK